MTEPMIQVEGLRKSFGKRAAVDGVSFGVPAGSVMGLLGPNGAGKTTVINCLTTLLRPDAGRVSVAGFDVERDPAGVRASIALTGQFAAVDQLLTGRQNLVLFGRLLRMSRRAAGERATELLARFDLAESGDRGVREYSGGMRRRLDLAAALMVPRPVLVLDEPTTGLDPRSRHAMWRVVRELRSAGTTVLLTTQYLEEADRLADGIVVVARGKVIATGTPEELKGKVGVSVCEVRIDDERARRDALVVLLDRWPDVTEGDGSIVVPGGDARTLAEIVRRLTEAGVETDNVAIRRPSLDDAFFALTGHGALGHHDGSPAASNGRAGAGAGR
ncbi:ATP-binding cassette domain-containing protein [Sphaerisporangium sp. TRM90804]|uniref:ATP-binding cassette domain-containing protein n=1 Tax=Sphaerisporangium sp. TRM90804 TaxID=3031113 RepID=UPI00244ACCF8|nr:ATP-binding cassette domain-containing protein [Sphaerisporangium sp. TRM90804]MDH2429198.1 ATP-binding cassette domain-containing protein [Sphaerisporangium sp. TRM90804]